MDITLPPLWLKLRDLRPCLPLHVRIQHRHYQKELWYLLEDTRTGRFHRINPRAYHIINALDGRTSLNSLYQKALQEHPEEAPTADDFIQLIQYLHLADLFICDLPPNTQELFQRHQKNQRKRWLSLIKNPLVWTFNLGNPNRLLCALNPLAKAITHPLTAIGWLILLGYALLQVAMHWQALSSTSLEHFFSPGNLVVLWLCYPALKCLHELGHALFTQAWGGQVNEWGVVFILGTPLPYVDASAATAFTSKKQRLLVSAAGMMVELAVAALALLVWLHTSDGAVKNVLFNIIILGSVSTLFFNANPLMRFDGYYLLTDLLDTPNLAARAQKTIKTLVEHFIYGVKQPAQGPCLQVGLLCSYAVAAFFYRIILIATLILMAAQVIPILAAVVAVWLAAFQWLLPCVHYVRYLIKSPHLKTHRTRVLSLFFGSIAVVLAAVCGLPAPYYTQAEGVVWPMEAAFIKAKTPGHIEAQWAQEGQTLPKDAPVLQLANPVLTSKITQKKAQIRELTLKQEHAWLDNKGRAKLLEEDLNSLRNDLQWLEEKAEHLRLTSPVAGVLRITYPRQLVGSFVQQGDIIGLMDSPQPLQIRTALTEDEMGTLQQRGVNLTQVRLINAPERSCTADINPAPPAATQDLPSAALGAMGGGRLALDLSKNTHTRSAQQLFLITLTCTAPLHSGLYGQRAKVRFYHPSAPLAAQWYRRLKQVFIRNFQQSL